MRTLRHPAPALLLLLVAPALLLAGGCARNRPATTDDTAADADTAAPYSQRNIAPGLAAPCGLPSVPTADWKEVRRADSLKFRLPPRFAAKMAEPWSSSFRTMDAELNVWTWSGKKWVFPPLVPGRSNRCTVRVNGREVDIEVVQLDDFDGTLPAGDGSLGTPRTTGATGSFETRPRRPRTRVYLATATWREQVDGQWVYAQMRSPLQRDMELFPTLVSSVRF